MRTIVRIFTVAGSIFLSAACSKSDQFNGNDIENPGQGNTELIFDEGEVIHLSGLAVYKTWEVTGGKVWQDTKNPCTADLVFLTRHDFTFTFTEPPKPSITCYGKIGDSGVLNFTYPTPVAFGMNITDIISAHVCATNIWGPGIEKGTFYFHGNFDGTTFTANAELMVNIAAPCPSNNIFDPALVRNPLHWLFGYDLTID